MSGDRFRRASLSLRSNDDRAVLPSTTDVVHARSQRLAQKMRHRGGENTEVFFGRVVIDCIDQETLPSRADDRPALRLRALFDLLSQHMRHREGEDTEDLLGRVSIERTDQIQSVAKRQMTSPPRRCDDPSENTIQVADQVQSDQLESDRIQSDPIQSDPIPSVAKRQMISALCPPLLCGASSAKYQPDHHSMAKRQLASTKKRTVRFAAAMAIALAACGGSSDAPQADPSLLPAPDSIQKTTEVGPVKAVVRVWPAKPSLIDTVYLRLEISAPDGVTIDAPFQEAGDQRLGRFRVVGFSRDTQRPASGGQLHVQTYTLEPPASGRQRIPPLRMEMLDGRATASADAKKKQEILTDEVPLEIAPVPVEQATAQLKDARGELDPDVGKTDLVLVLGLVGGALMLGSGSILLWRAARSRRRVLQQKSAYEDAVSHLRRLEDKGAPDSEGADSWFVELSAIVRRYLEGRYEIRAPELTTEEFLQVATARPELTTDHRKLLEAFLERCDRVKFAGYRPDAEESIATLAAARGFVEDTRLREVAV